MIDIVLNEPMVLLFEIFSILVTIKEYSCFLKIHFTILKKG